MSLRTHSLTNWIGFDSALEIFGAAPHMTLKFTLVIHTWSISEWKWMKGIRNVKVCSGWEHWLLVVWRKWIIFVSKICSARAAAAGGCWILHKHFFLQATCDWCISFISALDICESQTITGVEQLVSSLIIRNPTQQTKRKQRESWERSYLLELCEQKIDHVC